MLKAAGHLGSILVGAPMKAQASTHPCMGPSSSPATALPGPTPPLQAVWPWGGTLVILFPSLFLSHRGPRARAFIMVAAVM